MSLCGKNFGLTMFYIGMYVLYLPPQHTNTIDESSNITKIQQQS